MGIHRLEDLIHKEFQELVEMGCAPHRLGLRLGLRLGFRVRVRPSACAPSSACARARTLPARTHATHSPPRTLTRTHARTHDAHAVDHRQRHPPSQPPPPHAAFFRNCSCTADSTGSVACPVGRSQVETKRLQAQLAQLVSCRKRRPLGVAAFCSRAILWLCRSDARATSSGCDR